MAVDWLLIFTNLASGAWTLEKAASVAGVSVDHLIAQILSARHVGGRMAELAGRIITRFGITAAGTVAGGGAATGVTTGILGTIGGWFGLTGTAATVAGAIAVTAVLGGIVYGAATFIGGRSGDQPVAPGTRGTGANCPPQTPRLQRCPWTPADATLQPCPPGYCWDGGFRGTLACKQENQRVPNARLNDLNNLMCNDGFRPVRDPCSGVLLRCER